MKDSNFFNSHRDHLLLRKESFYIIEHARRRLRLKNRFSLPLLRSSLKLFSLIDLRIYFFVEQIVRQVKSAASFESVVSLMYVLYVQVLIKAIKRI